MLRTATTNFVEHNNSHAYLLEANLNPASNDTSSKFDLKLKRFQIGLLTDA